MKRGDPETGEHLLADAPPLTDTTGRIQPRTRQGASRVDRTPRATSEDCRRLLATLDEVLADCEVHDPSVFDLVYRQLQKAQSTLETGMDIRRDEREHMRKEAP